MFDLVILLCLIFFQFPGPPRSDWHDNSLRLR
jgi:hypothetical protein